MRLIDARVVVNDFRIEFNDSRDEDIEQDDNPKPPYAILSHTWGYPPAESGRWAHKADELKYQDVREFRDPFDQSLQPGKQRAYKKIYRACCCALDLGYDYIWIDTCCIDKSNSAELTESINSMFRWYSEAGVCIVYLVDSTGEPTVSTNGGPDSSRRLYTKHNEPCRWFSRCWTLQELLASKKLNFYDCNWNIIGTISDEARAGMDDLKNAVSKITTVDAEALLGRVPLWEYSVEAKMNWASRRKSGRPEDIAYSLLGIFDIHMPLIYGEGATAAFQRLQHEIMKSTPDLSLFAWHTGEPRVEGQFCSILADSPSQFNFRRRICRSIPESHHTMTNKGIQTTCIIHRIPDSYGNERYFMCLEDQGERSNPVCILLRKIGFNIFQRAEGKLTETDQLKNYPSLHRSNIYITTSLQQLGSSPRRVHDETIYIPPNYVVYHVVPEASWDCESRILLGNIPCSDGIRAMRLGVKGPDGQIKIGLVFGPDDIKSFACDEVTSIPSRLFTRTNRISLMTWRELLNVIPELGYTSNQLDLPNLVSITIKTLHHAKYPLKLSIEIKGFWESTPRASNHNPMTDDWQPMPEPFEYKAYLADGYPQEEQTTAFTPNQHHSGKRKLSENTTGRETVDKDIRSYTVDLADVYSPDGQTSTSILSHQQGAKRKFSENTDPRDTRWMKKDSNPSKTSDGQPSIKHKRRK